MRALQRALRPRRARAPPLPLPTAAPATQHGSSLVVVCGVVRCCAVLASRRVVQCPRAAAELLRSILYSVPFRAVRSSPIRFQGEAHEMLLLDAQCTLYCTAHVSAHADSSPLQNFICAADYYFALCIKNL